MSVFCIELSVKSVDRHTNKILKGELAIHKLTEKK